MPKKSPQKNLLGLGKEAALSKWQEENNRREFPTYKAAIVEISRLQEQNRVLKWERESLSGRRSKGRPRKLQPGMMGSLIKSELMSRGWTEEPTPLKNKGGRPQHMSIENMKEIILHIETLKKRVSKGKINITDKEILRRITEVSPITCSLPQHEKNAFSKRYGVALKYYRDKTGMRQKPKKRKTSSKNT